MIAVEAFGTMLARGSMPGPASCAHSTLSVLLPHLTEAVVGRGVRVGEEAGQQPRLIEAGLLLLLLSKAAAAAAAAAAWGVEGGKVLRGWLLLLC